MREERGALLHPAEGDPYDLARPPLDFEIDRDVRSLGRLAVFRLTLMTVSSFWGLMAQEAFIPGLRRGWTCSLWAWYLASVSPLVR